MQKEGELQRSNTDPDTRELKDGQGTIVGYNIVTSVDGQNKFITSVSVFNRSDIKLLPIIIEELIKAYNLEKKEIRRVLADAGFHSGEALALIDEYVEAYYVCSRSTNSSKPEGFRSSDFVYNEAEDCYDCPNRVQLRSNGKTYEKKDKRLTKVVKKFKKYTTDQCSTCPLKDFCLKKGGKEKQRIIEHSEYKEYIDKNADNLKQNPAAYKRRKGICEHPFGTLKRSYNMYYTNRKGLQNVLGEFSLGCLVYNMKRAINCVGFEKAMSIVTKVA
jgi:hypothetical protein